MIIILQVLQIINATVQNIVSGYNNYIRTKALRQKRVLLLVKQFNQMALKLYAMFLDYAGTVLDFTTPWQV